MSKDVPEEDVPKRPVSKGPTSQEPVRQHEGPARARAAKGRGVAGPTRRAATTRVRGGRGHPRADSGARQGSGAQAAGGTLSHGSGAPAVGASPHVGGTTRAKGAPARTSARSGKEAGRPASAGASTPHGGQEGLDEVPIGTREPLERSEGAYFIPSAVYGDIDSVERHGGRGGRPTSGRTRRAEARNRANRMGAAIAVLVLAGIAVVAGYLWWSRPLALALNGTSVQARRGTSIQQLVEDNGIAVTPGNLLSVTGDVIDEGQGSPLSATVNGQELDQDQIASYSVRGGEDIEVGNGGDITEDYDVTATTETQPKLRMEGGYGAFAYVSQWGYAGSTETRKGRVSGETADVTTKEAQDCVVYLHNVKPDDGQKLVALTFDDGPSEYTQQYLDILAKYNAKATFFMLGTEIQAYPDQAKAVAEAGCQVASHTNRHQQLTKLDEAGLQAELSDTFEDIKDITGVETTFMRPPYGDFTEGAWLRSGGLMSASIIWNQDSKDWARPGADQIVANSLAGVQPGSIILMHDGGGDRSQDVEALPQIIEQLQAQGYRLVTINDLIASDSSIPADIRTGNAKVPEGAVWPTELGDA